MEFDQHDESEEDLETILGLKGGRRLTCLDSRVLSNTASMEFEQHDESEEDLETILGPSMEVEQPVMHDEGEEDLETILGFDTTSKRRGPTTMSKLFKSSKGLEKVVEYNELGQPVGLVASQLSSFLGVLARYMVPIIYEKWTKVPKTLKDKISCCLEGKFVLHPNSKKNMI
ncbi:uncharacterized protein LOC113326832 isoform X1 [Papaver somniferum]|uniref:uncharacterized protein LOC113326832 isoform X1 n=1 Tax=Papaver somniferum TaxID=3469 RepID=UPI000E6F8188|nr:uncharacterized protein LOC113326832 isoform X1 [Papaver somniferum]XP_026430293.1 uncharacterized protein LOC113326832 isoform X1 [Papaver somniferum]